VTESYFYRKIRAKKVAEIIDLNHIELVQTNLRQHFLILKIACQQATLVKL
jgi:hypothetical protein